LTVLVDDIVGVELRRGPTITVLSAPAPVDGEAARVRPARTGDVFDQGGLTGAVLSDEGTDRAHLDPKVRGRRGRHDAEGRGEVARLEDGVGFAIWLILIAGGSSTSR